MGKVSYKLLLYAAAMVTAIILIITEPLYAYGSVIDWIYSVSAGIKPVENYPGFKRIQIAPIPNERMQWLTVSVNTAYGVVSSRWVYQKDAVRYEIVTPSPAEIIIDEKNILWNGAVMCFMENFRVCIYIYNDAEASGIFGLF